MNFDLTTLDAIEIPEFFNIGQACTENIAKGAQFSDDSTAIMVADDTGHEQHLSYLELDQQTNQAANALATLGCAKGDRVMLCMPNLLAFPISFLGTLKLGAIAVPSSMLLSGDELNYLAKDSGAKVLITTSSIWQRLLDFQHPSHQLESVILVDQPLGAFASSNVNKLSSSVRIYLFEQLLAEASTKFQAYPTRADDPAYLVYTSGTTGFPKGVLHAHRALLGRLPAARRWFDYHPTENDRILHSGKFNWTYVLGTALMDPLFLGKTVVVYEGQATAETWISLIAHYQCTIFIGVPTLYRQIIQKTTASARDVPSLRYCMCAGEHLSDELYQAWQARFELEIYEAIGMSECSYYLSQHPSKAVKPGSAGFVQPGHKVSLLNEVFEEVGPHEEGMLCIQLNDPGLFLGYWQLPEVTDASRQQGYFFTGDYAYRDEDGYIWFIGRKDDVINSFGYRISPFEIERVLKMHPDVADCVALEEHISRDKQLVVACIIPEAGKSPLQSDLQDYAREHLASYKQPKKYYLMPHFPRTANGKVLRKQLRQQLSEYQALS